ncbi:ABC transporter permease [Cytophagaceae bacterium DM2B3-1]|uniref:ABC transporter permease n=1 Tax=Xanthocytophaga flava TaxID=3048013 RepID=A0ABT7CUJ2_9BACT|nr:ABC transporter permease [Xanthocytophaga flavus]MDJ1471795.1 ABC transporter permease [Xanthocytophaga flavus]MDJ1497181.1 ABC transporter permease [Xanthocytophaga flavus]
MNTKNHPTQPPRWADRLLEWFVSDHLLEDVQGDLYEIYQRRVKLVGIAKAQREYGWNVIRYINPFFRKQKTTHYTQPLISTTMLRNYFIITWRQLLTNKAYSFLNIAGLATGMSVALLIGLWVYHQYSYDRFLPESEQLYQVKRNFDENGDNTLTFNTTSLKLTNVLRSEVPEIEYVAESDWMGSHGLKVGETKLFKNGAVIGRDFLQMFQYPLLEGDPKTALHSAYSIVLTESTAKALFGDENAMGKIVRFDNDNDLKVTGILKDIPSNSSFQFNFLVPFDYYEQTKSWIKEARTGSFGNNSFQIFVKLKKGADYDQVLAKIGPIEHTEKDNVNAMRSTVIMQPLQRWHLYSEYINGKDSGGFIEYVRIFSVIGVLVLLIACINFINLTTARSEKRAKEVGIRKSIGSERKQLIAQFLVEAVVLTGIAFVLAFFLSWAILPAFNALTAAHIHIPFANVYFWLITIGFVCITALLAGSRPAFYLSSFQPVKVLKGAMRMGKTASLPRKVLVVAQFCCSIALITGAIVIYQQVQYAKDRPTGYDVNRLLSTSVNGDLRKNHTALKNELLQKGIIESVTTSSSPATDISWHSTPEQWPGKRAGETVELGVIITDNEYFKTMGMAIKDGRNFFSATDTNSVIFNETAIKRLRLENPIGQLITFNEKQYQIAGVVKDALMMSPFTAADPTMFLCTPDVQDEMMYRLSPQIKTQDALQQLTALFTKYNPSYPYTYEFTDVTYAKKFNLEVLIGKLAGIFAGLAIFISCLGLFGLAAYMAEQRTKEVGIRKVLGASVFSLWELLSKDFLALVLIAFVIATPISWYLLNGWLSQYAYHTQISWWVFVLTGLGALGIALVTVSFQAIKAALMNPVKSLRSE